jgi:hypothetical protein
MNKAKSTIDQQQNEIEQTEQAVNDANTRYAAQEKRFQDFNQQVAAAELDVKQQAQAALDYAKQPEAKPGDIINKVQSQQPPVAPEEPEAEPAQPTNVIQFPGQQQPDATAATTATTRTKVKNKPKTNKDKSSSAGNTTDTGWGPVGVDQAANDDEAGEEEKNDDEAGEEEKYGTYGESMIANKKILKEQRKEGDPMLGVENYSLIALAYNKADDQVILDFSGNKLNLTAPQIYGMIQLFNGMSPQAKPMFVQKNLSFYNSTLQLVNSEQVVDLQKGFPEHQKTFSAWKRKLQSASAASKFNTKQGQLDFFGNPTMNENIKNIAENLMERFMSFKEAAKPDFLDLDKDGDTDEPMKSAAKSAKKHEPADIDKDAVAKRKRLQALKDKQEDERAEKGDYDSKSSSRVVKGRAYGGAAQKDDEDKDLDESGLQAYLGKKKYGKEGMKALQQAGREGASKEKMAIIRAKHDKFNESAKPDFLDVDKDGNKKEPFKKAVKDKKEVNEVAPPGAKAERMVKYIKKSLSKDGHLSGKDKAIAYATTWKARNKGQVEEATNFGDTIKNSAGKMTKVTVKEGRNAESSEYTYETIGRTLCDEQPHLDANSEAFVNAVYDELIEMKLTPKAARWLVSYDQDFLGDCATSYGHFCRSKEKEMAECGSPMNSFVSEQPTIDAVQELDEIARLAGLTREDFDPMVPGDSASPLTYAGCSKCNADPCCCEDEKAMDEGMGCSEDELNEAATRKDFRMVADLLKSIPDMAKRTELALYHADIFKQQNSRFKKEMFLAAAGVDIIPIKDVEDEVLVGEAEVDEGNEFSGALAAAKAAGEKEFEVDGKKYTVKEDINVNVTANGEEDVVNLIRKLSGMPMIAIQAQPAEQSCGACGSSPCGCESLEEDGPKEREIEYTNSPREQVAGTDAAIPAGADLNRAKRQYKKEYPGDNPMAVKEAIQNMLWNDYQSMINDVKA